MLKTAKLCSRALESTVWFSNWGFPQIPHGLFFQWTYFQYHRVYWAVWPMQKMCLPHSLDLLHSLLLPWVPSRLAAFYITSEWLGAVLQVCCGPWDPKGHHNHYVSFLVVKGTSCINLSFTLKDMFWHELKPWEPLKNIDWIFRVYLSSSVNLISYQRLHAIAISCLSVLLTWCHWYKVMSLSGPFGLFCHRQWESQHSPEIRP